MAATCVIPDPRTILGFWNILEDLKEIDKLSIDLLSDPRITNPPRSPTVSLHKGEEERLRRVRPVARMA
mgnify:CR=1 FL=1